MRVVNNFGIKRGKQDAMKQIERKSGSLPTLNRRRGGSKTTDRTGRKRVGKKGDREFDDARSQRNRSFGLMRRREWGGLVYQDYETSDP